MNEEEKKVEKQEQLFDLGNGRFVDVNKLIQVAQQDDNQDLYTSSWSLGSRRNAIKTSINETLQAIKLLQVEMLIKLIILIRIFCNKQVSVLTQTQQLQII